MKRLKKLLAVVLAGVMALTLLAGCAAASEKEVLNNLLDYYKLYGQTVEEDSTNYARKAADAIKTYYAANPDSKVPVLELVDRSDYSPYDDLAKISESVVKTDDEFWLSCVLIEDYHQPILQERLDNKLAYSLYYAQSLSHTSDTIACADLTSFMSTGTPKDYLSVCFETFGENTYAFLVDRMAYKS